MKRIVTVDLNGMSINLDEDAYDALRAYLRAAESRLASDPGHLAAMADLERSIGEKCQAFLHATKNVVNAAEMQSVLAQVGIADAHAGGEAGWQDSTHAFDSRANDRPLLQVREGAMISGVCNGLAAKFGIDVTIVRVIFVVLAIVTSGAFVFVYLALMFLIPYDTNVEKLNDHSVPGFMFKFVTQMKSKLVGDRF